MLINPITIVKIKKESARIIVELILNKFPLKLSEILLNKK